MTRNSHRNFLGIFAFTLFVLCGSALGAAFQFGGLRLDKLVVTSSSSTVVLTKAHPQINVATGSNAQVYKLPDATTLQAGYFYTFINESSGTLTISNSSSTAITTLAGTATGAANALSAVLYLTSSATTGGPWSVFKGGTASSSSSGTTSTEWTSYTPTLSAGFGTTSGATFFWRRMGDTLEVKGSFTLGTTASSLGSISLPTSPSALAIDSAKLVINNTTSFPGAMIGRATTTTINQYALVVANSTTSTSLVYIGGPINTANKFTPANIDTVFASSNFTEVEFQVPISGWTNNN